MPRSDEDVRISVQIEAEDRLDALRRSLAEVGLEGGWIGRAVVESGPEGELRVFDPTGGRAYVVTCVVGTECADDDSEARAEPLGVADEVVDEALLDESRLEEYFADEELDSGGDGESEVAESAESAGTVGSNPPVTRELAPIAAQLPVDDRTAMVLGGLSGLEDHVYDIQEAMDFAARRLLEPLSSDVACVLLVDRKGKAMGFVGLAGNAPARLSRFRYPKGLGLPWLAFDERRALLLNGIDRDAGLHREVLEKTGFRIRATVLAPIQSEGRTWGVVQAVRNAPGGADFTDADLVVLEAAATRLGRYLALFGTYL